ncbi:MAG TPA: hypothetical protein VFV81_05640 [Verrucomicrobiae bacterium]|nr:hypothetical protein [Verrucomicrobiae bacterium]
MAGFINKEGRMAGIRLAAERISAPAIFFRDFSRQAASASFPAFLLSLFNSAASSVRRQYGCDEMMLITFKVKWCVRGSRNIKRPFGGRVYQ